MPIREEEEYKSRSCNGGLAALLIALLLTVSCLSALTLIFLGKQENALIVNGCEGANCDRNCLNLCLTEDCVTAASSLLQNMDYSVSPCDDFYQFACGRWKHHHHLPSDTSDYDTFTLMKDQVQFALRDILEKSIADDDSNITMMVKNLYSSCMNEEVIETLRERPLVELTEELGGWPVVSTNWTDEDFDWITLMAKLRSYNNDILFSQWVGPDGKNSSNYIIQIDQSDLGLPSRDYYVRGTPQLEAYGRFMIAIAELLGSTKEMAEYEMEQVLEFESVLANLTIPSEERRNYSALYYKTSIENLQLQLPLINWTSYLSIAMPLDIASHEEVVVFAMPYLKLMSELVRVTPRRVVSNYLMWRFIYNRVGSLDKRFLAKQQEFYSALYGTQEISPRWKTCTTYVNKNMGMAVGALFVQRNFNENSKETAIEMIEDIKQAFLEIIDAVDWMDNETRSQAREKAELIREKIGFPEYILQPEELAKDYEGLEFKADTYFENILINLRHHSHKEQVKLRTPVDKKRWVSPPAVVNAFYTRSKNFITFPAGILQPPLYHQNYLRSLNYGGIGVVIGHEITHGFDDKGRQFDQHGNLNQWWNEEALARFQTKAECMVDQYGKYVVTGIDMKINGINTQGENIADNGGVKQAFRAYKTWESRHGAEPLLPGLNLSHHQLFFLNYAQMWCGTLRPEAAINIIRAGAHSPGRFRVIGVLSNSKDFSQAFSCPLGSPMNPIHKCEVW